MSLFPADPPMTRDQRDQERRAAAVSMLYAAIEDMPCEEALNVVVTAIRDDKRFASGQIEIMANELGREAHSRARSENAEGET